MSINLVKILRGFMIHVVRTFHHFLNIIFYYRARLQSGEAPYCFSSCLFVCVYLLVRRNGKTTNQILVQLYTNTCYETTTVIRYW